MPLEFPTAKAVRPTSIEQFSAVKGHATVWQQGFAFLVGFSIQFNMLIGGGDEGWSATGGFGYRLIDFVALGAACLLGIYSLVPHRLRPLSLYGLTVGVLFLPALALSAEPRTALIIYHYILYCFRRPFMLRSF